MFQVKRKPGYPAVSNEHQQQAETPRYGAAGKPGIQRRLCDDGTFIAPGLCGARLHPHFSC
jgi:hypothetical protein